MEVFVNDDAIVCNRTWCYIQWTREWAQGLTRARYLKDSQIVPRNKTQSSDISFTHFQLTTCTQSHTYWSCRTLPTILVLFLTNINKPPLAQWASFLMLQSSLFGPDSTVNADNSVTNSINYLLIGSKFFPNAHTNNSCPCFKTSKMLMWIIILLHISFSCSGIEFCSRSTKGFEYWNWRTRLSQSTCEKYDHNCFKSIIWVSYKMFVREGNVNVWTLLLFFWGGGVGSHILSRNVLAIWYPCNQRVLI